MPGGFDIDIQLFNYSDKIYPAVWQKKGDAPRLCIHLFVIILKMSFRIFSWG